MNSSVILVGSSQANKVAFVGDLKIFFQIELYNNKNNEMQSNALCRFSSYSQTQNLEDNQLT